MNNKQNTNTSKVSSEQFELNLNSPKKTLDEIWGIPDTKYRQKTTAEYKFFIKEMSDTDLRFHCSFLELPCYPDRALNIENLIFAFDKYQFSRRIYPTSPLE